MVDISERADFRKPEVRVRMRGSATPVLRQIADFSNNARAVWLGLIGLLAFCAVTLLGVRDADFFAHGARVSLPLLGVSAPAGQFFWAAPLAVLALYFHLHASLPKLWEALAAAPAMVDGLPLRRMAHPWVMSGVALRWRNERAAAPAPPFDRLAALGGALLGWAAAPAMLGWFWWRSATAHDESLTVALGLCLAASLWLAARSWQIGRRLSRREKPGPAWVTALPALILALLLTAASWERAEGGPMAWLARSIGAAHAGSDGGSDTPWPRLIWLREPWLARPDLTGAELARKPSDWIEYEVAKRAYRDIWVTRWRMISPDVGLPERWAGYADLEFLEQRAGYVDGLAGRDFGGRFDHGAFERNPAAHRPSAGADLRRSNLSDAFMAGLRLRRARLGRADLSGARLEGADLGGADVTAADLSRARAQRASFDDADLSDALLRAARLERADLTDARLDRARLWEARLQDASLFRARAGAADFRAARLDGASLAGADLSTALGLAQDQLEAAFGDAATTLPATLRRPSHWPDVRLSIDTHAEAWEQWRRTRPPQ